jgi:hypothetical protein
MAIGDVWSQKMGTGQTDRQPSSGVVEQISSIIKAAATDAIVHWDGTNERKIIDGANRTNLDIVDSTQSGLAAYNLCIHIDNGAYLRKAGTTDAVWVNGVQVDA